MSYLRLAARGWLIVMLTAFNVSAISRGHYVEAFVAGFGISFVWWTNAHTASHSGLPHARECYAFGAALGTITGMFLASRL